MLAVDRVICYTAPARIRQFDKAVAEYAARGIRPAGHIFQQREARRRRLPVSARPGHRAFAWRRRRVDMRSYSPCGVTHTTAEHKIMDALGGLLIAPVQRWDALVCTSRAAAPWCGR